MSMILEAMKRAKEGEAKTSDVPTVDTVHYVPEPETGFSRWQMSGMLAGVVVIIAVVLTAMWQSEPISVTAAPSTTSSATASTTPSAELVKTPASISKEADPQAESRQAPQPEVVKSVTAKVPPSYPTEQPIGEAVEPQTPVLKTSQGLMAKAAPVSLPTERERPVVTKSTLPSGRVMPRAAKPATSSDELRAIYQALNQEASQTAVTDEYSASSDGDESGTDNSASRLSQESDEGPSIDFADILAAAQEELGVKPLVESSEPLLETLSQQIKDNIPSLIYSEHRYDPAGRSSVTLNGKTLKERQRVGAFTVVEILPDSVVLRWRETQFRVRARNSWVNM